MAEFMEQIKKLDTDKLREVAIDIAGCQTREELVACIARHGLTLE